MAHQVVSTSVSDGRRKYRLPSHVSTGQKLQVMTAISGRNPEVDKVQASSDDRQVITVKARENGQAALDPKVESAIRHVLGDDYVVVAR